MITDTISKVLVIAGKAKQSHENRCYYQEIASVYDFSMTRFLALDASP